MKKTIICLFLLITMITITGCQKEDNNLKIDYQDYSDAVIGNEYTYRFVGQSEHFYFETGKVYFGEGERQFVVTNLKVKDSRIFKLDAKLYNKIFKNGDNQNNIEDENITSQITPAVNTSQESTAINSPTDQSDINYQQKYEEELKKNEELQNEINNLNNIINQIKSIIK